MDIADISLVAFDIICKKLTRDIHIFSSDGSGAAAFRGMNEPNISSTPTHLYEITRDCGGMNAGVVASNRRKIRKPEQTSSIRVIVHCSRPRGKSIIMRAFINTHTHTHTHRMYTYTRTRILIEIHLSKLHAWLIIFSQTRNR